MTISLQKGQTVSLGKRGGGTLTRVRMGLGWDAVTKKGFFRSKQAEIDLDATAVLYDARGAVVDQVWFQQLRSKDGSVVHTGDNRTGAGDGDDESIVVELGQLPAQVTTMVFVVNSFTGQDFTQINNAISRHVDETNGKDLARYDVTC